MKNSKALLAQAGLLPKLRLGVKQDKGGVKSTGPHRVKVLEDKIVKGFDQESGKEIDYVKYILSENNEKKYYQTKLKDKEGGLSYLVQRLAEINEGDEVILEMKRRGVRNYVEVVLANVIASIEAEE